MKLQPAPPAAAQPRRTGTMGARGARTRLLLAASLPAALQLALRPDGPRVAALREALVAITSPLLSPRLWVTPGAAGCRPA